jgi:hypothetical protein
MLVKTAVAFVPLGKSLTSQFEVVIHELPAALV